MVMQVMNSILIGLALALLIEFLRDKERMAVGKVLV